MLTLILPFDISGYSFDTRLLAVIVPPIPPPTTRICLLMVILLNQTRQPAHRPCMFPRHHSTQNKTPILLIKPTSHPYRKPSETHDPIANPHGWREALT